MLLTPFKVSNMSGYYWIFNNALKKFSSNDVKSIIY